MRTGSKLNNLHSHFVLDEARSPVARFRLLSKGINNNTRLLESDKTVGDSACLACGNCIDNCPVVRFNVGRVFIQNQRTSMALENIVEEECRRCYRCVNACPQVNKSLKEYTLGFRRVEKIVHLIAALIIVVLAVTGVTHSHYAETLGSMEGGILKYGHRAIGIFSIIIPYLYYRYDICHFRRTLKKIFTWGPQDLDWLRNTYAHIFRAQPDKKILRHEFNPAQKFWYLFVLSVFPILYLSGWSSILFATADNEILLLKSKMVHMLFALSFDLMLFTHVYIKYVREWSKNIYQQYKNYRVTRSFVFKN